MVGRGCVFLDRDGVINVKPPLGKYIGSWEEFHLLPTVTDWIRLFNVLGYLVIVVTNQRGVALGLTSREAVETIHTRMVDELARRGARIDDVFYCPHDESACMCRKPLPGLIEAACQRWGIDLSKSLLIGDSDRDSSLANAVGVPFVRVQEGSIVETETKARRIRS